MSEPSWLAEARRHLGMREIPGVKTAPAIERWLTSMKVWWRDDETPWCGVFADHCLRSQGFITPKNSFRAKAWLEWGAPMENPELGCIVVFGREGGGHVGFVVGRGAGDTLAVLGGNQSNAVTIALFGRDRVLGYRWPLGVPQHIAALPPVQAQASLSEA